MADIIVERGLRSRLEDLVGRRREVRLVAAFVAVAGTVALILWMRGAPATIAPPATSSDFTVVETPGAPSPAGVLFVHVSGAVRKPGVYELASGARVADAVDLAAPRPGANLNGLNLAEPIVDGSKIDVPRAGEVAQPVPGVAGAPVVEATPGATMVNVNTADMVTLETLPEIGPVTAQAIIDYRTQIGSFTAIEQLLDVSGIGPATFETIRALVTV